MNRSSSFNKENVAPSKSSQPDIAAMFEEVLGHFDRRFQRMESTVTTAVDKLAKRVDSLAAKVDGLTDQVIGLQEAQEHDSEMIANIDTRSQRDSAGKKVDQALAKKAQELVAVQAHAILAVGYIGDSVCTEIVRAVFGADVRGDLLLQAKEKVVKRSSEIRRAIKALVIANADQSVEEVLAKLTVKYHLDIVDTPWFPKARRLHITVSLVYAVLRNATNNNDDLWPFRSAEARNAAVQECDAIVKEAFKTMAQVEARLRNNVFEMHLHLMLASELYGNNAPPESLEDDMPPSWLGFSMLLERERWVLHKNAAAAGLDDKTRAKLDDLYGRGKVRVFTGSRMEVKALPYVLPAGHPMAAHRRFMYPGLQPEPSRGQRRADSDKSDDDGYNSDDEIKADAVRAEDKGKGQVKMHRSDRNDHSDDTEDDDDGPSKMEWARDTQDVLRAQRQRPQPPKQQLVKPSRSSSQQEGPVMDDSSEEMLATEFESVRDIRAKLGGRLQLKRAADTPDRGDASASGKRSKDSP